MALILQINVFIKLMMPNLSKYVNNYIHIIIDMHSFLPDIVNA